MFCLDTDVLSAVVKLDPPLHLIRRLARTPATEQCTTAITLGELLYGVARRGSSALAERVQNLIQSAGPVLAFDEPAAQQYGRVRASLERDGRRLAEPDLRIAAIALSRDATLVTANVRHFARVPGLCVENWLIDDA
ncbi:MAG: tRNA(fMet)-specific endonuclease VapC [Solirubrobacteraceae bacterium]|jgi:tRNA(fMet)-specific endonuclease VapC|nr:tRNA(fMet)-specific endonuclease VapC [Solirubrobacteraceae bacterium]